MHALRHTYRIVLWCSLLACVALCPERAMATADPTDTSGVTRLSLAGLGEVRAGALTLAQAALPPTDKSPGQTIPIPSNCFLQGREEAGQVWFRRRFPAMPHLRGQIVKLVFT